MSAESWATVGRELAIGLGYVAGGIGDWTAAMDPESERDVTAEFEDAVQAAESARYVLRLYVTGLSPRSISAIESTKQTCEEFLKGRYELEVIDLTKQPALAEGEQIIAAPTLIKRLPLPLRRLVGDLSSQDRVLLGLDLRPRE